MQLANAELPGSASCFERVRLFATVVLAGASRRLRQFWANRTDQNRSTGSETCYLGTVVEQLGGLHIVRQDLHRIVTADRTDVGKQGRGGQGALAVLAENGVAQACSSPLSRTCCANCASWRFFSASSTVSI